MLNLASEIVPLLEREVVHRLRRLPSRRPLVEALARAPQGVWIYGAGGFGRGVARGLAARHVRVAGFIDAAPAGSLIDGRPVLHTTEARLGADAIVLLGIFNPLHPWAEATEAAFRAGASEVYTAVDIVDVLPEMANYWLVPTAEAHAMMPELASVAGLLADERSVAVLRDLLVFRLSGDVAAHPAVDVEDQYLATDLRRDGLRFDGPISFLDGGAFTGDTGLFLVRNGVALAEWAAFEPDAANFVRLVEAGQSLTATRCSFFPLGLSDRLQDVAFVGGDGAASRRGDGGGSLRMVAADEVLAGLRPDYIKLDVEGAESAALRGMARMIEVARPKLAVCVYHQPRDLATLTRQVRTCLPEARLYLRQHAHNAFDTVLYAIA